jgi:hypothetical protein
METLLESQKMVNNMNLQLSLKEKFLKTSMVYTSEMVQTLSTMLTMVEVISLMGIP